MLLLSRTLRTAKYSSLLLLALACGGSAGTADRDQFGFAPGDGDGDVAPGDGDGDVVVGTGASATGGLATGGGVATGGAASGGDSTGGVATGGMATGGMPVGTGGMAGVPNGYYAGNPWNGYAWTTSGGMGTTVMPSDFSAVAGPPFCMSGTVAADVAYGGFAQLGINLNQGTDGGAEMTVTPTLSGLQIELTNTGGSALRVQIQGPDGGTDADQRWCADVSAPGGLIPWTDFNTECWDNGGNYYAGEPLVSAGIIVPGDNVTDTPYNFCINSIGEGGDPWGGGTGGSPGTGGAATGGAGTGGAGTGGAATGGAGTGGAGTGGAATGGAGTGGAGTGGAATGGAGTGGAATGGAGTGGAGTGGAGTGGAGTGGSGTGGNPGGGYYLDGDWGGYGWTASTTNSSITPDDFAAEDDLPFCASGTVAADPLYGEVAMLGVNLNQAPGTMTPANTIVPTMEGVEVFVSNFGGSDLRLQIQTENGAANADERWCVNIVGTGGFFAWSDFNTQCWDGLGQAYAGQALESASILVPGHNTTSTPFDFCLEGLSEADDPDGGGTGGAGTGGAATGGAGTGGAVTGGAGTGGAATGGAATGGAGTGGAATGGTGTGGAATGGAGTGGSGTGGEPPTYDGGYLTSGTWEGYTWTDANGAGSTISPDDFSDDEDGLPYCVSGTVAPDASYGNVAQLAWNVNQDKGDGTAVGSLIPSEDGIEVSFDNYATSDLRVQIVGVDPTPGNGTDDANRYCAPLTANGHIAWTEFNTECWDYTGDAYDTGSGPVEAITSISILVPGDNIDPVDFDFCLTQLEPANSGGGGPGGTGFGYYPTTVDSADAQAAYAQWKLDYLVDCGSGVYRVASDVANETVSEGIGYGMLMAATDQTSGQDSNNQDIFDGLWAFYNQNLTTPQGGNPSTGLMNWRVQGCGGTTLGHNSATDAELDVAMALIMADARWPGQGYGTEATALISRIKQHETTTSGGYALLKPGDQFGGADCLNASYFAPGYYRAFADHTGDAFWDTLADDTYVILANHDHNTTGLVPNWADMNGNTSSSGPSGCNWYSNADKYYYDAARTPWRIGLDYNWYGTAAADSYLDTVSTFVEGKGVGNLVDGYYLDGGNFGNWNSAVFVGAFGVGSMAHSQSLSNSLGTSLKNLTPVNYFDSTLRVLYLQMLAGDFDRP